jgi:hypothetical protein
MLNGQRSDSGLRLNASPMDHVLLVRLVALHPIGHGGHKDLTGWFIPLAVLNEFPCS